MTGTASAQFARLVALDALKGAFEKQLSEARAAVTAEIVEQGDDSLVTDLGQVKLTRARVEITDQQAFEAYAYEAAGGEFEDVKQIAADADMDKVLAVLEEHLPEAVETVQELTKVSRDVAMASLFVRRGEAATLDGTSAADFAGVRAATCSVAATPQKKAAHAAASAWVSDHLDKFATLIASSTTAEAVPSK